MSEAEDTTTTTETTDTTTTTETATTDTNTEKWYSGVDETILKDPALSPFLMENGDISKDLLKSYVHAQRSMGKKRIAVPDKNTTDAEFREILTEIGLPSDKENYKLDTGETKVDEDFLNTFKEKAFELGVLPKQANELLKWQAEMSEQAQKQYETEQEKSMTDAKEQLEKDWGEDYKKNMERAAMAVHQFAGDKELAAKIIDSDLGNNPDFLNLMTKVSSALDEDKFDKNAVPSHYLDKVTAERKINELQGDLNGPYYNKFHPAHDATVKEVNELFQIIG